MLVCNYSVKTFLLLLKVHSRVRQFLSTKNLLNMIKNIFYFTLKNLFFFKIFQILLYILNYVKKKTTNLKKRHDKKDKVNFKIYDDTNCITNNYNYICIISIRYGTLFLVPTIMRIETYFRIMASDTNNFILWQVIFSQFFYQSFSWRTVYEFFV